MPTRDRRHRAGSIMAFVVWGIATGFFFWDYLQQVAPAAMGTAWERAFGIDAAGLGVIAAFYFYSYGLMQIPVGLISDHFGPHRPLVAAAAVAVAGNVVLALTDSAAGAALSRLLIGLGTAFSYVCCLKLISNWFPARRFASMAGLTALVGMTGGIAGEAGVAAAVSAVGWRGTVVALAAAGGVLLVLLLLIVRDHPAGARLWQDHPAHQRGLPKIGADLKHVLTSGQTWLCGLCVSGLNAVFFVFGGLWGAKFLTAAHGLSARAAEGATSLLFVGGIGGAVLWGPLSDRLARRKLPLALAAGSALALFAVLLYAPTLPRWSIYALLVAQGLACSGYVVAFALGHDVRPPGSAGVSMGFINTCSVASTAVFQPAVGAMLDNLAGPGGATAGDYRLALTAVVALTALAVAAALLTRETRCRPQHPQADV